MFTRFGTPELLIILFIVVMVFGVGRLPEFGASLGKAVREVRKATSESFKEKGEPEGDDIEIETDSVTVGQHVEQGVSQAASDGDQE